MWVGGKVGVGGWVGAIVSSLPDKSACCTTHSPTDTAPHHNTRLKDIGPCGQLLLVPESQAIWNRTRDIQDRKGVRCASPFVLLCSPAPLACWQERLFRGGATSPGATIHDSLLLFFFAVPRGLDQHFCIVPCRERRCAYSHTLCRPAQVRQTPLCTLVSDCSGRRHQIHALLTYKRRASCQPYKQTNKQKTQVRGSACRPPLGDARCNAGQANGGPTRGGCLGRGGRDTCQDVHPSTAREPVAPRLHWQRSTSSRKPEDYLCACPPPPAAINHVGCVFFIFVRVALLDWRCNTCMQ
jgi:hypothetical protein